MRKIRTTSNVFNQEEVKIFKFWDGEKNRGIDPLDASIMLGRDGSFDWQAVAVRSQTGDLAAVGELVEQVRTIFKLKHYEILDDGKEVGVTSSEVLNILMDFMAYMDTLKKNIDDTATSTPSTDVPTT